MFGAASWSTDTGSDLEVNQFGLPYNHGFSVLGTVKLSNGTKLLKIRNPWAVELYKGPWSDYSSLWTDSLREEAGQTIDQEGIWFISAEDYHQYLY